MGLWFVVLWVLSVQYGGVDAFFDWLKKPAPAPAPPQESIDTILLHGETPAFEMSVVDEKFLAEAKQMELSPLDSCHFREGQTELREMTAASLDKLLEGHSALQLQQGALKEGQEQLDASISQNLQRLAQEKALISTGQQLVAQLIQGITQRMENVSGQLKGQSAEVQEGHQAILQDLAVVRGSAQDIYEKMELNLNSFLQQQNSTAQFYSELMTKLERMNGTLGYMLTYLDSMQTRLEDRLLMIQGYLGWAGLSLRALWTCVMHAGYFLLSAVLLSFLQCATFSRISLLLLVPINAIAEINQQTALDLLSLTLLLFTLSLGRWFVLQALWVLSKMKGQTCSTAPLSLDPPKEKTPEKQTPSTECCPASSSTPVPNDLDCDLEVESFMMGDPHILSVSPSQSPAPPKFTHLISDKPSHSTPRLKSRHSIGAAVLENIPQRNLGGVLETVNHSRSSSPNHSLASNSGAELREVGTTLALDPSMTIILCSQLPLLVHSSHVRWLYLPVEPRT
ncbi:protein brambleberry isoform X4 [Carassius gibelio]|uniref:protein brambleberry isoform X4 n=1 Tax=Carassius gibelio TaxID=101364 RepID=UPI0022785D89|nr:protein brambleberry isoform X4 [Carassius gibelio]